MSQTKGLEIFYVNPRFFATDVGTNIGLTLKIPAPSNYVVALLTSRQLVQQTLSSVHLTPHYPQGAVDNNGTNDCATNRSMSDYQ